MAKKLIQLVYELCDESPLTDCLKVTPMRFDADRFVGRDSDVTFLVDINHKEETSAVWLHPDRWNKLDEKRQKEVLLMCAAFITFGPTGPEDVKRIYPNFGEESDARFEINEPTGDPDV